MRVYRKLPVRDKLALVAYMDDITERLLEAGVSSTIRMDVSIILDELITNIFMHGYEGKDDGKDGGKDGSHEYIYVSCLLTDKQVTIRIRDVGAQFNPLERETNVQPISDDIFDLELGGLGVFMVRERADSYDYRYQHQNGQNIQTITKLLPQKFYENGYSTKAESLHSKNELLLQEVLERKGKTPHELDWQDWEDISTFMVAEQKRDNYTEHFIPLTVSESLQRGAYKLGVDYDANIHVCSWGDRTKPSLICFGGILNTAERFSLLGRSLADDYFVIGVSWLGRGSSDWSVEQSDYNLDCYTAHIDAVIDYFKIKETVLLGSSLGGSACIRFISNSPNRGKIRGLILNDTGPLIPASRRSRRSIKVARHYSFKTPQDIFRLYELANRAEGYIPESFLLLYAYWQTKSIDSNLYSYNHDYRALAAYRLEACNTLDQRQEWNNIDLPILLLHGSLSTALSAEQCQELMKQKPSMRLLEIKYVGHTPPLTDDKIIGTIGAWMNNFDDKEILQQTIIVSKKYKRDKIFIFNAKANNTAKIKDVPLVKEFYVIRHGKTDFNTNKIRCGSEHDVPLNRQGVEDAIRIGLTLKSSMGEKGEYSRIYCGTLQRVLKTASIVGGITGICDFHHDSCFDERWLGEYSGTPLGKHESDIREQRPPKGGESEEDFSSRVYSALDVVMHHAAVAPIIVTSRGFTLRLLRHLAGDFTDEVLRTDIIYYFSYDVAKEVWQMEKLDSSKVDFDKKGFAKILLRAENSARI